MSGPPRGLALRVLLASLLGVLVAGVLMFFTVVYAVADMAIERSLRMTEDAREDTRAQRVAACLADPESWSMRAGDDRTYAYSASTARSANPEAPPLDLALRDELEASDAPFVSSLGVPPTHGAVLLRFGPPGPCELLSMRFEAPVDIRRRGFAKLWLTLVVLLALAGALAIFAAIRPTLARIEALAACAESIGDAQRFTALEDPAGDALAQLAAQVAHSHERIVTTTTMLRERATALEQHLEDVAHDLRTPIAALQLRLEQLRGELDGSAGEQLSQAIGDVVYLTQLTANLRLASRLEHGLPHAEHVRERELGELVQRVVARFAALGELRGVKVRGSWPAQPVRVDCDPTAAEQALANLVHNALLHAAGEVTVVLERFDARFELRIIDDGPGVAPEQLARLTERRVRGASQREGSGLGLAIVAEVCRRFAWSLALDNLDPSGLEVRMGGACRGEDAS